MGVLGGSGSALTCFPRPSLSGRGAPQPGGRKAGQLLARLDARPLAARAAADMAALVRRAGATLGLRHKEGGCWRRGLSGRGRGELQLSSEVAGVS